MSAMDGTVFTSPRAAKQGGDFNKRRATRLMSSLDIPSASIMFFRSVIEGSEFCY